MLGEIIYEFYESVDSTNERIKARARDDAGQGLVISADEQTAGKGRVGRKWETPSKDTVATSILLKPYEIPVESVATITIVAAMAVRAALEKCCGLKAEIKWPNDLVIDGKKICGILTEMEMRDGKVWFVTCGIGVNVHNKSFPEEIAFKATSVDLELAKNNSTCKIHRSEIIKAIWESFKEYYNVFIRTGDLTNLRDEYQAHLANSGKRVRIEAQENSYEATALGINNKGELIIEVDGKEEIIRTGEVSVRGIYGYS